MENIIDIVARSIGYRATQLWTAYKTVSILYLFLGLSQMLTFYLSFKTQV